MLIVHQSKREKCKAIVEVLFYTTLGSAFVVAMLRHVNHILCEAGADSKFVAISHGRLKRPETIDLAFSNFGKIDIYECVDHEQAEMFAAKSMECIGKHPEINAKHMQYSIRPKPLPQVVKPFSVGTGGAVRAGGVIH